MKRILGLVAIAAVLVALTACGTTTAPSASTSAIAAGGYHSSALESDGSTWAWGDNINGQLGNGTSGAAAGSSVPVRVVGSGGSGFLSGVTSIAAGSDHSLALASDGSVWAWGANDGGQLGDNTVTQRSAPVQVVGPGGTGTLAGVIAVAAGGYHSLALMSDGSVWAWGDDRYGQLGNGTGSGSLVPVEVVGPTGSGALSGVAAIAAGEYFSLALKRDGSVWAWGGNTYGQLGDNTTSSRAAPVQVVGPRGTGALSGVTAVAAGSDHSLALDSDGSVWAWGYNGAGQFGDDTIVSRSAPVEARGLP